MNRNEIEGNWHQLKGKIQEKWGKLTNDDLAKCNGKYDQLLNQLEKRYGYTREHAEQELKNLCGNCSKGENPRDKMAHNEKKNAHEPHNKNKNNHQNQKEKYRKAS